MNIPDKKIYSQHHFVTMLTVQIYLRDCEVQVYVPPSDATNTVCTVRDALYAIRYPGPLFNHLGVYQVYQDLPLTQPVYIRYTRTYPSPNRCISGNSRTYLPCIQPVCIRYTWTYLPFHYLYI